MQLDLIHLAKEYCEGKSQLQVINDVNLSITEHKLICITGKSGSGKTTLLNLIAGLLEPTSGSVVFNGDQVNIQSDAKKSFFRNDNVGYVMQGYSALDNLTVYENVVFPSHMYKRDENPEQRARELLSVLKIEHLRNQYPRHLSGGELRRMYIARALINKPDYLIADEPTNDLDENNIGIIMKLLREIADKDTLVILVTHNLDILNYADELYEMNKGNLIQKE